jgi:hypothetical protein
MSYHSINNINHLLTELFPTIINGTPKHIDTLFDVVIANSFEFCELAKKQHIKIKKINMGGFSDISIPMINDHQMKAIIISLKKNGGFEPYYSDIILKQYRHDLSPEWKIIPQEYYSSTGKYKKYNLLLVNDPLSEMIFGGLLGHLYDLGICPFVGKYFGIYLCGVDNSMYQANLFIEKSSIELKQCISRNIFEPHALCVSYVNLIPNILFQYIHMLYVLKLHLGFTHFDTNHRNIMLSFIHSRFINLDQVSIVDNYIYNGENLSKKNIILFQTPFISDLGLPICIAIQNIGFIVKLLDFGVCSVDLREKYNIAISCTETNLNNIGATENLKKTLHSKSYSNTVDLLYLLLNIYQHLTHELDIDTKTQYGYYSDIIQDLDVFSELFFGSPIYRLDNYLQLHPEFKIQKTKFGMDWIIRNHDIGIYNNTQFDDPKQLVKGLLNICKHKGGSKDLFFKNIQMKIMYFESFVENCEISPENTLYLETSSSSYQQRYNNLQKFIQAHELFKTSNCSEETTHFDVKCNELRNDIMRYNINTTIQKNIKRQLDPTVIEALTNNKVCNIIKTLPVFENIYFSYYHLPIYPEQLKLHKNDPGSLVYHKYHSWFDYKSILDSKIGQFIELVNIHIVHIKNPQNSLLFYSSTLWNNHLSTKAKISINCGYFIVPGNLNRFYPHLTNDSIYKPIGYSYIKYNTHNGTYLPFPTPYHDDLYFIYGTSDGIIFEEYETFMSKHTCIKDTVVLETTKGKTFALDVDSICMSNGTKIGENPLIQNNAIQYNWAFCSGPILIKNGQIIFTETKMNTELLIHDNDLVLTIPDLKNVYKWRSASSEGNQYYGMRHSNRFMVHNVLAKTHDNNVFVILCEGRGFDAPGLDRAQLSHLIWKFNIKDAVSLDGGFSANAIITNDSITKMVLPDPEQRQLGCTLHFF